jgi:hypothetical protein
MQQCRLIAAISHLSDVGCGKTGFSAPSFLKTLPLFVFCSKKILYF